MPAQESDFVRNSALQIAINEFQRSGGTFNVAYSLLCSSYAKSNEKNSGKDPKKPGHTKRNREQMESVADVVKRTAFSLALPDGRLLGHVRWCELGELASKYGQFSRTFSGILDYGIPENKNVTVQDFIPEKTLKEIIRKAKSEWRAD